jgi:hypothetical protein
VALRGLQTATPTEALRRCGQLGPGRREAYIHSWLWRPPNLKLQDPIMYEYSNATALFP